MMDGQQWLKGDVSEVIPPITDRKLALMKSHMLITHVKCAKFTVSGAASAHCYDPSTIPATVTTP